MQSQKPTRDIADFFKPYARSFPEIRQTVPRKRSSPFADRINDNEVGPTTTGSAGYASKTPTKAISFKNVTPTPSKSASKQRQQNVSHTPRLDSLPIRSPRSIRNSHSGSTPQPGLRPPNDTPNLERILFTNQLSPKGDPTSSQAKRQQSSDQPSPSLGHNVSFAFSDVSDRNQSVIQNGKLIAVRDSDEEDSDELESLQDIFSQRKYPKGAVKTNKDDDCRPGLDVGKDHDAVNRVSLLGKFADGRPAPIIGRDKIRQIRAREKGLEFDLSEILNDELDHQEVNKRIERVNQEIQKDEETKQKGLRDGHDDGETRSEKLLTDVILNAGTEADVDDVARVMSALQRTEALSDEKVFSFFDWRQINPKRSSKILKSGHFPVEDIPNDLWKSGDNDACARAYLSGVMTEKAAQDELADKAIRWTFDQILCQKQDDLRQAYLNTVEAAGEAWIRLNVTPADVQSMFRDLGASTEVLHDNTAIEPRHQYLMNKSSLEFKQLLTVLDLLQSICSDMDMPTLSKLSSILLRLSLDDLAMSNGRVAHAVETLFQTLFGISNPDARSHVYNRFLSEALQHLRDPNLQARLLLHIPASSSTANELRKTLADVFLLGPSVIDSNTNSSRATLDQLAKHVSTSSLFQLSRRSNATPNDYVVLASLVSILDIATGSGNAAIDRSSQSASSIKEFNISVDALAGTLKALLVSIKDSGASHMRRTEAKDILQALYYRLLYHVRIGVRAKKHVFDFVSVNDTNGGHSNRAKAAHVVQGMDGSAWRQRQKGQELMRGFLKRAATKTTISRSDDDHDLGSGQKR